MNTEKKWKRGDIGTDGRVFWVYGKQYRNGEQWIDADKYKQRHQKATENVRSYHQENREKAAETRRRYIQENREKVIKTKRRHYQENREKLSEVARRRNLKITLQKISPKTLQEFYDLLYTPKHTINSIFTLNADEGQTLAELIHELSGYPMELCEQIANPSEPEPEPQPTPEPQQPPVILPDLF